VVSGEKVDSGVLESNNPQDAELPFLPKNRCILPGFRHFSGKLVEFMLFLAGELRPPRA